MKTSTIITTKRMSTIKWRFETRFEMEMKT